MDFSLRLFSACTGKYRRAFYTLILTGRRLAKLFLAKRTLEWVLSKSKYLMTYYILKIQCMCWYSMIELPVTAGIAMKWSVVRPSVDLVHLLNVYKVTHININTYHLIPQISPTFGRINEGPSHVGPSFILPKVGLIWGIKWDVFIFICVTSYTFLKWTVCGTTVRRLSSF